MKFHGSQRTKAKAFESQREKSVGVSWLFESSSCDPKKQKFIQVSLRKMEPVIKGCIHLSTIRKKKSQQLEQENFRIKNYDVMSRE